MNAQFRSMRARMTALFAVFVALLMLLGGAAVARRETRRAEKRTREILEVALERAQVEMKEGDEEGLSLLQVSQRDASEIAAGGLVLVVADASGTLWKSHQNAPQWPGVSPEWRFRTLSRGGQTLVLARKWEPIEAELRETKVSLWGLGFIVVAATTLGAWLVVGKTLSPLEKLAAQAQNAPTNATAGAPSIRLQSPSSDAEMRHLTATLNELLSRLEKESLARGRFYAAASHELRTPIQSLLGQIDVAQSRPRTLEQYAQILAQLGVETERLASLTQDLLQLNALEMRQNQTPRETLDLKFWVERALSQQSAAIQKKSLGPQFDGDSQPCEILAPPLHVEMLLRNLLDNAVKYATPQTPLRVSLVGSPPGAQKNGVVFSVWNACSLAPESDLGLWFEPFFRPDEARSSATGGNGLGLSIVASLARANGWSVHLETEKGGVRASVCFPRA